MSLPVEPSDCLALSALADLALASLLFVGSLQTAFISGLLLNLSCLCRLPHTQLTPLMWVQVSDALPEILGLRYISNFRKVTLYIYCILTPLAGSGAAASNPAH